MLNPQPNGAGFAGKFGNFSAARKNHILPWKRRPYDVFQQGKNVTKEIIWDFWKEDVLRFNLKLLGVVRK